MERVLKAIAALACLALPIHSSAAPVYYVYDLGLMAGASYTTPYAINAAGDVVGQTSSSQSFIYSQGQMTTISAPGSSFSAAYDIDDSGQIAGMAGSGGSRNAVVWTAGQVDIIERQPAGDEAAFGINNVGQVVGRTLAGTSEQAFVYQNGAVTVLGTLGGNSSAATAINDAGQIVGMSYTAPNTNDTRHGFLYVNGAMVDLGHLGGGFSTATDINDQGQIVGASTAADGSMHAFVYSNGTMSDLGMPDGYTNMEARSINNLGDIVGLFPSYGEGAFLYSDGVIYNLNDLLFPGSGWTITDALDINDSGQIAAMGWHPVYAPYARALLLDFTAPLPCSTDCGPPSTVPLPAAAWLLLSGLGGLGFIGRRKAA